MSRTRATTNRHRTVTRAGAGRWELFGRAAPNSALRTRERMAHMAHTDSPAADDRTEVRLLAEIAAGGRTRVRRALSTPSQRRVSVRVCDGQVAQLRARRDARGVSERPRKCQSVRQRQRLGARMAVRLCSLRDPRSAAPRTPLDRRAAGRRSSGRRRRAAARRPTRGAAARRHRALACRVSGGARAVRAAGVVVRGDGRGARMSRSARCGRACIAAARCSSRCSTKANARAADSGPRVATPLQAGEVCS